MRGVRGPAGVLAVVVAVLAVAVGPAAAFPTTAGTFVDDDGGIHEGYIEALVEQGVTEGCNPPADDRYCPAAALSRGQMAALLTRALDLPASDRDAFVDDDGTLFEDAVDALADAGLTGGCNPPANDRFCPTRPVTRAQMAAFLAAALDLPASDRDVFVDDDGSPFEPSIDALAASGITGGCNPPQSTRFCGRTEVTRAQLARFLGLGLELEPLDPTPLGGSSCAPAYLPCVPPRSQVDDLDCPDVVAVYPEGLDVDTRFEDQHRLNADGDDRACEPDGG